MCGVVWCVVVFFVCVCVHVVCVVWLCGVGVVCVHVVWCEAWHAENSPVCTFKTPSCVRLGRFRVYRQQARMCSNISGEEFIFYYSFKLIPKKSPPGEITGVKV